MSIVQVAKNYDKIEELKKQLADIDTDLSNTSDLSYTWSLLVQAKADIQRQIGALVNASYNLTKLSGY